MRLKDDGIIALLGYFVGVPAIILVITNIAVFLTPLFPETIRAFYATTSTAFIRAGGFPGMIAFTIVFVALPLSVVLGAIVYLCRYLLGSGRSKAP